MSISKLLVHFDRGGFLASGYSTEILKGGALELASLGVTVTKKRV